jgi:SPP1 family predicted phage head-tail adaptor
MATTSLSAGRLRHRISIEDQTEVLDSNGARVLAWVPVADVWAAVEPLSAREFIQSASTQSRVVARITIRARELSPTMRIIHRGQAYNIHGVLPDKNSGLEYVTLPVEVGVNDGR